MNLENHGFYPALVRIRRTYDVLTICVFTPNIMPLNVLATLWMCISDPQSACFSLVNVY